MVVLGNQLHKNIRLSI